MFKFEANQKVRLLNTDQDFTIQGRTEFFNDRQPRYYIANSDGLEQWVNESDLTADLAEQEEESEQAPKVASATRGKKSIRKGS